MRAYRAAIVALALGFMAVLALILVVELSSDDDNPPGSDVGGQPTNSAETVTPTSTRTPDPTPDIVLLPYFQELDTIFQRASDESVMADTELQTALSSGDDFETLKGAYTTFLTSTEAVFATAITSMDALTVPDAAQEGHTAFRAAADSSRVLAGELKDSIATVTSEDELMSLLESFGADKGPLLEEADNACLDLQETANTHGIFLDLACSASE